MGLSGFKKGIVRGKQAPFLHGNPKEMMRYCFLAILLVFFLTPGQGVAKDMLGALRRAAEGGDVNAQNDLGMLYAVGRGVLHSEAEAAKWFRKAAEQGNAESQYNLALMYGRGQGVTQDLKKAAEWAGKAARQGFAKAQALLGMMYELGDGVAQAYPEAVRWYQKAANQGEPLSQLKLGLLMEQGQGAPQDSVQALVWFYLAKSQGNTDATPHIDRLVGRLNTAQMAQVQEKVRSWKSTEPSPSEESEQNTDEHPFAAPLQVQPVRISGKSPSVTGLTLDTRPLRVQPATLGQ